MALGFHFPGPLFLAFTWGSQVGLVLFYFSQDVNLPRNLLSLLLVVVKCAGWFTCGHTVGGRLNGRGRYGQRWLLRRPFLTLSADERKPGLSVVSTEPFEPGGVPRGHPAL